MGGFETKLKLLACQGNDRSWNIVPGNELIAIEDTGNLGDGALVMVTLNANQQVQGTFEPASTRIIGILQGYSRLLEKSKSQEEEIETWKESLTIQSEQLSARELEMETRLEQLERMEQEFNQFEKQRQEISTAKQEAQKLKIELESKTQQLAQEREQLQTEQRLLAQNLKEAKFIDEAQAAEIQGLLESLSSEINATGFFKEHLQSALSTIAQYQELLTNHWQKLEQNQKTIEQERQNYLQSESVLNQTQSELKSLVASIGDTKQQRQKEQHLLETKQELIAVLVEQSKSQAKIQDSLALAGIESSGVELGQKLDVKALENMSLSELEAIVSNLQQDLEKVAKFVQDQEEELSWQCQAVEELEQKIKEASEFDRLALDHELAEEKEAKKMLDETLVGQRRSLKERHERLLQHSRILKRRQGVFDLEAELQTIDLEPIKNTLKHEQEHLLEQQKLLESQIVQIQQNISGLDADLQEKVTKVEALARKIQEQIDAIEEQNRTIMRMQAELNFYQDNLQPLQDGFSQIKKHIEHISSSIAQDEGASQNPSKVLTEIDRMIKELVST